MLAPPWLLALGLVVGLLILIPARRLQLAGMSSRTIGLFALGLWLLAMAVAIRPTATRILVPILLIAYIAPFIAAPDRVRRVLGRGTARGGGQAKGRPPMKNVTPPESGAPPASGVPRGADVPPEREADVPPERGDDGQDP